MLHKLFRYGAIAGVAFSCTFAPLAVAAQDITPEPTPAPSVDPFPTVPPVEETTESFLSWLLSATNGVQSLAIVIAIVTAAKHIKALNGIPAGALTLLVSIIYSILVWVARGYGFADELAQGSNFLTGLLDLLLNLGTGATVVTVGSGLGYEAAKFVKMPIVKYQRVK